MIDTKTTDIRCRGIILHNDKILAVKHSKDGSYFALPGGHLEWGESVIECIKREITEELGIIPEIGRLLYVRNYVREDSNVQSIEFHFEITNSADYVDIDKLTGTHSHELAEICWIGKNDTRIIKPIALQEDLNNGTILSDMIRFS
jgi:ADP-ribose pyrophosphatase YjhB (NUDIX family)